MDKPDPSSIISKYRKLFGISAAEEVNETQQISKPKASNKSNAEVPDAWLDPERFIREPVEAVEQNVDDAEVGYEHVMFNSLFAATEEDDVLSPVSHQGREAFFKDNALKLDILAASFARRLYEYELDLRQAYDPAMGMYPTQALYAPRRRIFKWGGGARQPVQIRPYHDPKRGKGKPSKKAEIRDHRKMLTRSIKVVKKETHEESDEETDERKKKKKKS